MPNLSVQVLKLKNYYHKTSDILLIIRSIPCFYGVWTIAHRTIAHRTIAHTISLIGTIAHSDDRS